jgi:hypothetical protein
LVVAPAVERKKKGPGGSGAFFCVTCCEGGAACDGHFGMVLLVLSTLLELSRSKVANYFFSSLSFVPFFELSKLALLSMSCVAHAALPNGCPIVLSVACP